MWALVDQAYRQKTRIGVDVKASIDGVSTAGVSAASVSLTAEDTSTIYALAGAVSVAGSYGGTAGVSVSIGVSLARNTITTEVEASIKDHTTALDTNDGKIEIQASETASIDAIAFAASIAASYGGTAGVNISGAGADANNIILGGTSAFITDSVLSDVGIVDIDAKNSALIDATIVAVSIAAGGGGTAGVGASIGVSLARNYIGYQTDFDGSVTYKHRRCQ